MRRDLIKHIVLNSNTYTTNIGEYLVPVFIISKGNHKINIINRRNDLINKISSYESSFIYDCEILKGKATTRKRIFEYIREFFIPIENDELWKDLLISLGANEVDDETYFNTNYFFLDFLFPKSDLVVEIDSNLHDDRGIYDEARDLYLKYQFGLTTLRFYEYGKELPKRLEYSKLFRSQLKKSEARRQRYNVKVSNITLDFSNSIINSFIKENLNTLLFIDQLERFIGKLEFLKINIIEVSKKDLAKISPKNFKGKNGKYEENELFLNNINYTLNLIYRKSIILKNYEEEDLN